MILFVNSHVNVDALHLNALENTEEEHLIRAHFQWTVLDFHSAVLFTTGEYWR